MARTAALPEAPVPGKRRWSAVTFMLLVLPALVFLSACATMDFSALRPGIEERGHYIASVPFYRQGEDSCGPAALAGVASFWGQRVDVKQIRDRVYLPELRGTLPMDMERFMREAGFLTSSSSGTLRDVKAWVRKNMPVICLLDMGFSLYRKPHYVTVIGFDDINKVLITHDGLTENKVIGYEKFLKEWERGGNWMLVALPGTTTGGEKQ
jgi:ABC-type bacteriocin/lantibiotic exporter with double-glycine peptidase domain